MTPLAMTVALCAAAACGGFLAGYWIGSSGKLPKEAWKLAAAVPGPDGQFKTLGIVSVDPDVMTLSIELSPDKVRAHLENEGVTLK